MREIKFRVWDMKHNEYIYWDELKAIPGVLGMLLTGKLTNSIIEQFTGLHDCEGKEIYEGDIVEITTPDGDVLDVHDEIVYSDIHAAFFLRTRHVDICSFIESDYTFKIIGNIHEK